MLGLFASLPANAQTVYITASQPFSSTASELGIGYDPTTIPAVNDSPTVDIISGANVTDANSYNSSVVNVTGGTVTTLTANGASTVNFSGGSSHELVDNGGSVNISGGTITGYVYDLAGNVVITGGTFASGQQDFDDSSSGLFEFIGTGLSAGPGITNYYGDTFYTLSGTLQNGQSITGDVFIQTPGAAGFTLATPEPSPLIALALGIIGVLALTFRARRCYVASIS